MGEISEMEMKRRRNLTKTVDKQDFFIVRLEEPLKKKVRTMAASRRLDMSQWCRSIFDAEWQRHLTVGGDENE